MAVIEFLGTQIETCSNLPPIDQPAPNCTLVKSNFSEINIQDFKGQPILLHSFPSIETKVCFQETQACQTLNQQHDNLIVINVSMDLPYVYKRFEKNNDCQGLINTSDFRNRDFGHYYGVTLKTGILAGLLARAIFYIDEQQILRHVELVDNLENDCDLTAIKNLLPN